MATDGPDSRLNACGDRHMQLVFTRGDRVTAMRIRPWIFSTVLSASLVFGTLYVAAAGYLFMSDELIIATVEDRTKIRHQYEDQITFLRTKIDRITSRYSVAQQSLERELRVLIQRQEALDVRQDIIANLSQAARRAELPASEGRVDTAAQSPAPATGAVLRGTPEANGEREARVEQFEAIGKAVGQLAGRQTEYVGVIAQTVAGRADRLSGILRGINIRPRDGKNDGVGGPLVALDQNSDPESFRTHVALVTEEIERFSRIKNFANSLPLDPPLGDAMITSGYGRRVDPFLKRPAIHGGVDFRAHSGEPVKTMAPGVVITAGYSGGYGKLVAIDHGNGIVTRFGHMRRITVKRGQTVARGDKIGEVGSTGRSTGPHLHYEVRHNGKTVDPTSFFRAGRKISELL
jgi:murein DD-endopeptidase MepM/ murein hydrolase activator NlpD